MEHKSRLGRGLEALLSGPEGGENLSSQTAPIDSLVTNPLQPRRHFDEDELASLTASIREQGVLQPVIVRQADGQWQLIAGERRFRAAKAAGLTEIPIRVVQMDDQQVLEAALAENIHRADLNPIEKAQGFQEHLRRFQQTHDQLAKKLGLARSTITNLVALLDLPQEIQTALQAGQITTGHAKVLKGVDAERQLTLCREIIARGLSVHALEDQVRAKPDQGAGDAKGAKPEKTQKTEKSADIRAIEEELRGILSVKAEVKLRGDESGSLVIEFQNNDDFERIVDRLRGRGSHRRAA